MEAKEFRKTIGHKKQKELFLRLFRAGKLSHGYVLVGPENIGKTTFAVELAEVLGANPMMDVYLSDQETGLLIEEARKIQNRLSLTPVWTMKVGIITYAERMTLSAANALLKLLEEPPPHSLLFLITSNYYGLLPTIASRMQRINFSPVSAREVAKSLQDFYLTEEKSLKIVEFSGGRIGLARTLSTNERLYNFYKESKHYYQILEKGSIFERLQTAQKLALLETKEINQFLKFAMQLWLVKGINSKLAQKILEAFWGLGLNLNTRLLLDNLFIP